MTNAHTGRPLKVEEPWRAAPIIRLPVEQAGEVSALLDSAGVRHWVQLPGVAAFGQGPWTSILLTFDVDVEQVQRLLDTRTAAGVAA